MADITSDSKNKMGSRPVFRLLLSLGIPTILSLVLQSIYNLVDTVFVINMPDTGLYAGGTAGQIGNIALTCAVPIQLLIIAFGVGTGIGINALLSKSLSEKDNEKASKIIGNGIFLIVLMYLVFLVVGLTLSKAFIKMQSDDPDVIEMGSQYMLIVCTFSFGTIGFTIFERFLQASGKSMFSMISEVTAACVNIFLDWVFIYPLGMGVKGAAWATVISQILSFIMALIFQFTINKDARITSIKHIIPDKEILGGIYKVGWSAIIIQGLLSIMMFGINIILGTANPEVVNINTLIGTFGIYYKVMQVALYVAFGFSNTIITLLSFNYGLQDKKRCKQCIKQAILIMAVLMVIIIALFEGLAHPIAYIFGFASGEDSSYIDIVTRAIRIASIGYVCMGINVAIQGIFQGLRMAVRPLIVSALRFAVIIFPLTYVFLLTSDPLSTWWWAFPITEVVTMVIAIFMLFGVWRKFILTIKEPSILGNNKVVITISRQHGSNGRIIGKALADKLGIEYYDKEILAMVSESTTLSKEYLEENFLETSSFRMSMISKKPTQEAIIKQKEVVNKVASESSCVIVGRAANYFLKDNPDAINVFIYADEETRINNIMSEYGDTREEAIKNMHKSDKSRGQYYRLISSLTWGEDNNYDICLDSSIGVDASVNSLYEYIIGIVNSRGLVKTENEGASFSS